MPRLAPDQLLAETHQVMSEARDLVRTRTTTHSRRVSDGDVLALYEALCSNLESIETDRLRSLLWRIADKIERLNRLAQGIERVHRIRRGLREF